jgi:hypothetical protein
VRAPVGAAVRRVIHWGERAQWLTVAHQHDTERFREPLLTLLLCLMQITLDYSLLRLFHGPLQVLLDDPFQDSHSSWSTWTTVLKRSARESRDPHATIGFQIEIIKHS